MMRRVYSACLVAGLAAMLGCDSRQASAPPPTSAAAATQSGWVDWRLSVAIPKREEDTQLMDIAGELSDVVAPRLRQSIWTADINPVCCFWVDRWAGPESPGYVMTIRENAAFLMATDEQQMRAAIDLLKRKRRVKGDVVELPLGVFTNYPIEDEGS